MDFKSLLSQLDQLNEATEKTKTGLKHTAEPGGYGRKDAEDEEGNKVKDTSAEKKGRGRPKKATQSSGEDKKYDFSAFGVKAGKDIKLPKWDKKKTKKHSIKEYLDQVEKALNEAEQVTIQPAQSNTQVIKQGTKTLGTVTNPQLAQQIKQSIGKGEMSLAGDHLGEEDIGKHNNATTGFDALVRKLTPKYGVEAAKRIAGAQLKKIREADMPPRDALASPLTLESRTKADDKAEKAGKKVTKDLEYDMGHKGKDDNKAEKAGKKVTKDIEYDEKKKTVKEAAKPDFLDMDKDGDKKEPMKKAVADKKKKVKEGMDQRLNAARSEGKAHGLRGHAHCGKNYEDMEEARCYHEGYKEGLDECYGQVPIQGYVGETNNEVADMASYGAHTPSIADEGNAFTGKLKSTPQGSKFTLGGKTFKDTSSIEESPFAFESWDKQLNALLESKVDEGMSVSISKGQQGSPDSVSVTAQDGEADQLLDVIKSAGLGLFGGDDMGAPSDAGPMTVDTDGEPAEIGTGGNAIEVVGDHDGMMSLMKKLSGIGGGEEHSHEEEAEESCNECGMAYESCGCDEGQEMVDEVESEDQMTYQVAEDNPPDSGEAEEATEIADTQQANAAAAAYNPSDDIDEGADGGEASDAGAEGVNIADVADETEEDLEESLANGADDTFESDIDFMTNVITGGLNKRKQTGQTTIPVVASQLNRQVSHNTADIEESADSVSAWKKLAGIN